MSKITNRLKLLLFTFFTTASLVHSADLNTSLIDANEQVYRTLLLKTNKTKTPNEETSLSKVLLTKLINMDANTSTHLPIKAKVNNSNDYYALFEKYLDSIQTHNFLNEQKQLFDTKLHTLKNEITITKNSDLALNNLQLQYAFYNKTLKMLDNEIVTSETLIKNIGEELNKSVVKITLKEQEISQKIDEAQTNADKFKTIINQLIIKKERLALLNLDTDVNNITHTINDERELYKKEIHHILILNFLKFSFYIQHKNDKAFTVEQTMNTILAENDGYQYVKKYILSLSHDMEKSHLGLLNTIASSTKQELLNYMYEFMQIITKPMFSINNVQISILKIIISIISILFGFFAAGYYKNYIRKFKRTHSLNATTKTLLTNLGYYTIIFLSFIISLNILGINLSSIALVAGALSVGIGFGLQNIVSNFISGIILMFEKSVKVDDYVELSDNLRGHVVDIRMRSTIINTNENIDVIVPNQNFIQNNVVNWTMNDNLKRFDVQFSVAYGTDLDIVIKCITNAVQQSNFDDVYNDTTKFTRVIMSGMGNSSVDLELLVWLKGNEISHPRRTKSRFLMLIYKTLYENGITIPFPQLDLHIKKQ